MDWFWWPCPVGDFGAVWAMRASPWIVSDELWERIQSLPPKWERRLRYPGRGSIPDRQVLCGILFVLHTGIQWEHLPQELGFGSGCDVLAPTAGLERGRRPATAGAELPQRTCRRLRGSGEFAERGGARANRRGKEAGDGRVTPVPAARGQGVDEPGVGVVTDATRLDLDHFVPVTDVYDSEQAPWSAARGEGCFTGSQWWVETAGRRQCAAAKWRRGSRNALCRGELRRVAAAR